MGTGLLDRSHDAKLQAIAWYVLGAGLLGLALAFTLFSSRFSYDYAVEDMPILWLVGGLMLAGILYLALVWLIPATLRRGKGASLPLLAFVAAVGLAMRLLMFASEPVLEDDYHRYLWDGAVTAHGLNPYVTSPETAMSAEPGSPVISELARESGEVLGRINHPHLRTIYPPVAQGAFALSYMASPWSLQGWRLFCLTGDIATAALLLFLLLQIGRSPLWLALYWWNPLIVKELLNTLHMEALLMPLVLAGLALAVTRRYLLSTLALVMAAGVKIWPAILLPLVWRPLVEKSGTLAVAAAMAAGFGALFALPILWGGLDLSSGFVAYAQKWENNSALFPQLEALARQLSAWAGNFDPRVIARICVAGALLALALWLARKPSANKEDLIQSFMIVIGALVLLSPTQYPWYTVWILALMPLRPVLGILVLTATMPLYYLGFYFLARGQHEFFKETIVWFVWIPVWSLLAAEFAARFWRRRRHLADATAA